MSDVVREHPDGSVVSVRAQPGASRAAIVGLHGDALKVRVCSPPVDGRANDELVALLAASLDVREREITVIAGHASRSKHVVVHLPPHEVLRRLAPWISPVGGQQR